MLTTFSGTVGGQVRQVLLYMVMSRDRNAGRSHNVKNYNKCFERAEQFNYLETTQMNQNSIQEENKNTLHSGNACYHLQNLWSSSLLSKNIKIKMQKTVILTVGFVWV